jgi:hypothetical protein
MSLKGNENRIIHMYDNNALFNNILGVSKLL